MSSVSETEHRAAVCHKKLGNPLRYKIYRIVGNNKEITSNEIAQMIGRPQPTVTQHLNGLKENDMIQSRREGQFVYYKIKRNDILLMVLEFEKLFQR